MFSAITRRGGESIFQGSPLANPFFSNNNSVAGWRRGAPGLMPRLIQGINPSSRWAPVAEPTTL